MNLDRFYIININEYNLDRLYIVHVVLHYKVLGCFRLLFRGISFFRAVSFIKQRVMSD